MSKLLRLADNVVFCFDGDAAGRMAAGWKKPRSARPSRAVVCPMDRSAPALSAVAAMVRPGRNVNSRTG